MRYLVSLVSQPYAGCLRLIGSDTAVRRVRTVRLPYPTYLLLALLVYDPFGLKSHDKCAEPFVRVQDSYGRA